MPEIKQNFTRGKMNKDLDERLIPKGEYREAQNIHITESEGSDVGAIENVLGNIKATGVIAPDLTGNGDSLLTGEGYEVIGYCQDLRNKRVVFFITNFESDSFTDNIRSINRAQGAGTSSYSASTEEHCAIILYDIENKVNNTLVFGSWLNLSKNHLITGVQIIDDLLFWTDDLNQPRKINIKTALDNYVSHEDQYYDCEETVSVAKYAPYNAPILHEEDGTAGHDRVNPTNPGDPELSDYMKERFIRFSYRYKYDDGEYSLIAPFTQSIFEPLNAGIIVNSSTDDERNTTTGEPEVLIGHKEIYKKGIVDIMQNRINQVELRIPIPNKDEFSTTDPGSTYTNPYHIKEIEILLKESDGISFKLVKTLKISELQSSDIESYTIRPRADFPSSSTQYYRQVVKYTYNSSEPYQVLSENQVNRVYDQVPLLAKALDVSGSRVIFGNYVENYAYPTDSSGKKGMNYTVQTVTKGDVDQANKQGSTPYLYGLKQWMNKTLKYHTVKQRRTYQVGIVFSDIFGRQSPVILSSNESIDADTITVPEVTDDFSLNLDGLWNATNNSYGNSLAINFEEPTLTTDSKFVADMSYGSSYNPHGWYSYRIVVKQQEQDYYNVYAPHTFDGWDNINEKPDDTLTGGRSWLYLHGDNVNKVPRSLNDTDLNRDGTMGSNVRLYPKVVFDTDGYSKMNSNYHELTEVISLGTAYEQNLYISGDDNKSGTGGFTVYKFVYGKDKNPLVAELQNMEAYSGATSNNLADVYYAASSTSSQAHVNLDTDQLGTSASFTLGQYDDYKINFTGLRHHTDLVVVETATQQTDRLELSSTQNFIAGDKVVLSKYYEGLSVFETEPFKSKLDIYYETSTSGLVADLVEEIFVETGELPDDITVDQFGYLQDGETPPVQIDNTLASVYEQAPGSTIIGELDATQNAPTPGTLSFSLFKVINTGSGQEQTGLFSIINDAGTYKLTTTSTFVYQNNNNDEYVLTIAATDNGGTNYENIRVVVINSAPNITAPAGPLLINGSSGTDAKVIYTDNDVDNGSARAGGFPNKYNGVTVTFSFGDTSFNSYFYIGGVINGKYELLTSGNWTPQNAAIFFNGTNADRTVTLTVTDDFGLTDTASVRIDDIDNIVVPGNLFPTNGATTDDICEAINKQSTIYYAIKGTSSNEPSIYEWGTDQLVLYTNNIVYLDANLQIAAPSRLYAAVVEEFPTGGIVYIYAVNTGGVVGSVTAVYFNPSEDCQ
jgi:hypothetical protein